MDSKKRLIVTSVISIILVSILMIGSTYSIFNSTDVDQESNVYQTGNLEVTLEDSNDITLDVATPLSVDAAKSLAPHRIKVTNKGTVAYQFNVILSPTTATSEIDHQYIMAKVGKLEEIKLSECSDNIIASNIILPAGKSVDIDVRVWISDEVQNTEMNKSFNARLKIDGIGIYNSNEDIDNSALVAESLTTLALGTYVSMTPTKSSYTTDTTMTGYKSQTFNPQELNLWRVISVNDDGSMDIISEYASSTEIVFVGLDGYLNFSGYLNVLASQYENTDYTTHSRHFGYNGQTEYITDTSKFTNPAPWTSSTSDNSNESVGGGDTLYQKDYDLVNNVLGTTVTTKFGADSTASYWAASRFYSYSNSTYYYWIARKVSGSYISVSMLYIFNTSEFNSPANAASLRPILTLKPYLTYTGEGTKDSPMVISN